MRKTLCIPAAKMAGEDLVKQKQEELKRKLQNKQSNSNSTPDKKKVKWGQLILGIIGLIAGAFLMARSNGTGAALVMVIALIVFFAIYAAIKNNNSSLIL